MTLQGHKIWLTSTKNWVDSNTFIFSQFWNLTGQNQGVGRVMLPLKALGEKPSLPLPSPWLPPVLSVPGLADASFQSLCHSKELSLFSLCVRVTTWPLPLCMSLSSYGDTNQFNPLSLQPNSLTAKNSAGVPYFMPDAFSFYSIPLLCVHMYRSYAISWSCIRVDISFPIAGPSDFIQSLLMFV